MNCADSRVIGFRYDSTGKGNELWPGVLPLDYKSLVRGTGIGEEYFKGAKARPASG